MILEIEAVKYVRDYILWLRFNDGVEGTVDLADELTGPVFGPLADKRRFRAVRVDSLLRTVVWPNEADLAPEFLYERLTPSRPGSGMSTRGRKARHALRIAVREAVSEHHREGVPIAVREPKASYRAKKGRKR
ncbi:MAG: DUF2442 domain-containing protein [Kiritimatiellae bacterium]|nr:DUF2442 domain-containing protein [Kiritimatiellia bacterium]MCO5062492.1 DUF2442 domain-containing protein [Kiritimatiellia bacterium]MCO5068356.1 DUF2442 domain-containing protein [Kiritimatiellia bacterium]